MLEVVAVIVVIVDTTKTSPCLLGNLKDLFYYCFRASLFFENIKLKCL